MCIQFPLVMESKSWVSLDAMCSASPAYIWTICDVWASQESPTPSNKLFLCPQGRSTWRASYNPFRRAAPMLYMHSGNLYTPSPPPESIAWWGKYCMKLCSGCCPWREREGWGRFVRVSVNYGISATVVDIYIRRLGMPRERPPSWCDTLEVERAMKERWLVAGLARWETRRLLCPRRPSNSSDNDSLGNNAAFQVGTQEQKSG